MHYRLRKNTLKLTETGIDGCCVEQSHFDVSGKFGGHLAWIVHYTSDEHEQIEIYRHVGSYYNVGKWAGEPGPSKWNVANDLVELLDGELSVRDIMQFIKLLLCYRKYK